MIEQKLKAQLERCVDKLAELEPATETYRSGLADIGNLIYIVNDAHRMEEATECNTCTCSCCDEAEATPVEEPKPAPVKIEAISDPTPPVTEPDPGPVEPEVTMTLEEVRAILAEARTSRGVNVVELLKAVGAKALSGVDPKDYAKLAEMAKNA